MLKGNPQNNRDFKRGKGRKGKDSLKTAVHYNPKCNILVMFYSTFLFAIYISLEAFEINDKAKIVFGCIYFLANQLLEMKE